MSWKENKAGNFPVIIFVLIVAAFIVVVLLIYSLSVSREKVDKIDPAEVNKKILQENESANALLIDKYRQTIKQLVNQISSSEKNIDQLVMDVEAEMLKAKVPKTMLDQHLKSFVELQKIKTAKNEEKKEKLLILLGNLDN